MVGAAVKPARDQHMIAGLEKGHERRGDRGHTAGGYQPGFRVLERREFLVQRQMVGQVVEPGVFQIAVGRGRAIVLKHGRLKDRHGYRALNTRFRFARVDQLCL